MTAIPSVTDSEARAVRSHRFRSDAGHPALAARMAASIAKTAAAWRDADRKRRAARSRARTRREPRRLARAGTLPPRRRDRLSHRRAHRGPARGSHEPTGVLEKGTWTNGSARSASIRNSCIGHTRTKSCTPSSSCRRSSDVPRARERPWPAGSRIQRPARAASRAGGRGRRDGDLSGYATERPAFLLTRRGADQHPRAVFLGPTRGRGGMRMSAMKRLPSVLS